MFRVRLERVRGLWADLLWARFLNKLQWTHTQVIQHRYLHSQTIGWRVSVLVCLSGRDLVHWRFTRSDANALVDQRQVLFAWHQVQNNVCSISQLGRQKEPQRQVITPLLAPTEDWAAKTPVNVGLNSNSPEL